MANIAHGEIDTSLRYRVEGWPGIAVWIKGWTQEAVEEDPYLICDDEDCDHDLSEMCWAEGDVSIIEGDMLRVVMVGDDKEHIVDPDDLVLIHDSDYCPGCGQIGCKAYG